MTVYADVLFALNSAINYLLLVGSARLGGGVILRRRVIPAACLGGLYAVLALIPELGFLQGLGMKAVSMAAMVLVAFGGEKRTVRLGLLFLALAAGLAGLVLVCIQALGRELMLLPSGAYYPVTLTGLLLLAAVSYGVVQLVFSRLAEHGGEVIPLTVALGSRQVQVRALQDTGNTLRDPISNRRVLVIGWDTAARLLPEANFKAMQAESADAVLQKLAKQYPDLAFRLIPYRAVGTGAGLLAAVACTVAGKGKKPRPAVAAFCPTPISDGGNFDALAGGCL